MTIGPAGLSHPRIFATYLVLLLVAAGLAIARGAALPGAADPVAIGLAFVLMGASEMGAVALPAGGYVSIGGVLDLACLLILGPFATAWINIAATVLTQGIVQRRPLYKVAHNAAAFALKPALKRKYMNAAVSAIRDIVSLLGRFISCCADCRLRFALSFRLLRLCNLSPATCQPAIKEIQEALCYAAYFSLRPGGFW